MYYRYRIQREIEKLDPVKDHIQIVKMVAYQDMRWDSFRALEFALFRTFAVPTIGRLLGRTHEFTKRTQKRYDDTDLILGEIIEDGYDSPRGKAALERLNKIHGMFNISNEDFIYVLTTFVVEPYKWVERFGYRGMTMKEKIATHKFWYEVGKRMHIKDIPESFEGMVKFGEEYEKEYFGYSKGGHEVAVATESLFLGWYLPKALHGIGRPFVRAIMDEPLLEALQLERPSGFVRGLTNGLMQLRRKLLLLLSPKRTFGYRTKEFHPTYPNGYTTSELGPDRMKHMERISSNK